MHTKRYLFYFASIITLFCTSCYYNNYEELHPSVAATTCDTNKVMSYATDIAPIMIASCGSNNSCHGTSNTSGYDLSSYAGVNSVVQSTLLYSSIIWDGNASQMPKGSSVKLLVCDITKIKKWIDNGAPNN